MDLPLLPASISGSLPKPRWLATPDQLWADWRHQDDDLSEAMHDAIRVAVHTQERAGIDIVTDGEQTRRHFVTTFIDGLEGVDAVNRDIVQIRRRYEASVPRVVGEVRRPRALFVGGARQLRSLTDRSIKFTLPGPMTVADTLSDQHYGNRETLAMAMAALLNEEARDLVAAGVDLIQFDEPAFNVFLQEVGEWGIDALEAAAEGLEATTAVHICYGYGIAANIEWKSTLGQEWRQYEVTFPLLAKSSLDEVSMEIAGSHVPLEVLELLGDKTVQAGVIDVATDRIEAADEVAATLDQVAGVVSPHRVVASTNCGMVPLSRAVAEAKLAALGAGAALARGDG